jgi:membrane dipeptidase
MTASRAQTLIARTAIWDNHACMPLRPNDSRFLPQLERHRSTGVRCLILNVNYDGLPWHAAFRMLARFRTWVAQHADLYGLISSTADLERMARAGKMGIAFNVEGGGTLDDMIDLVEPLYALGVRWMSLVYNRNNALGGGCLDDDRGLTDFGRRAIERMHDVGMVMCCSHTGHRTALEAISVSKNPMIFSHSNSSAVWPHARNIPDELILACASTGGVVNVNGIGIFLGENDNSTSAFVRHVEHIASLAGPDHVGMGLDYVFDVSELEDIAATRPALFGLPPGTHGFAMIEPERIADIVETLLRLGWSDAHVAGLLGSNNLRVAETVWK